jgi:hypothetical protein
MGKLPACSGADKLTELDRLKLVIDYDRLQNATKVAKKHGVGRNTVRRWVNSFKAAGSVAARPAQAKVDSQGCKTIEEFKKCVIDTPKNVPEKMLQDLVGSMGKRVKACIENNGGKTKH